MTATYTTTTANHETVEDLIRYAAHQYAAADVIFPASRVSKLIRRAYRGRDGAQTARAAVDVELTRLGKERAYGRHAAAEPRAEQGYMDPTGAEAARHLDSINAAASIRERWAGVRHEWA